ncbi:MAG: hypothetical protein ACT6QS_08145 [Flavobacteriales bacterium]
MSNLLDNFKTHILLGKEEEAIDLALSEHSIKVELLSDPELYDSLRPLLRRDDVKSKELIFSLLGMILRNGKAYKDNGGVEDVINFSLDYMNDLYTNYVLTVFGKNHHLSLEQRRYHLHVKEQLRQLFDKILGRMFLLFCSVLALSFFLTDLIGWAATFTIDGITLAFFVLYGLYAFSSFKFIYYFSKIVWVWQPPSASWEVRG